MASNYSDTTENFISFKETMTAKELLDRAKAEFNETSELREEYVEKLRSLIRDNNIVCITRDDFLLRFLRTRKFEIQATFESLENYVKVRAKFQNNLIKLQPEAVKKMFQLNILGLLPFRDDKGSLIFFYRSGVWTEEICSEEELLMTAFLLLSYLAEDPMTQINGVQIIADNNCFALSYIAVFLRHVNILKAFFFKSLPVRYRQCHLINGSSVTKYVLQVAEVFLPEKIKKRMLVHTQCNETLFEHISPAILPFEFGGHYGPLSNDHLLPVMDDYLTRLKDEKYFLFEEENTVL